MRRLAEILLIYFRDTHIMFIAQTVFQTVQNAPFVLEGPALAQGKFDIKYSHNHGRITPARPPDGPESGQRAFDFSNSVTLNQIADFNIVIILEFYTTLVATFHFPRIVFLAA